MSLLYCQRFLGRIRRRTSTFASLRGVRGSFPLKEMSMALGLGLRLRLPAGEG